MKGFAKQSVDRFPGVLEFAAALRQAIEGVPVTLSDVADVNAAAERQRGDGLGRPPPVRMVDDFEPQTISFDASPASGRSRPWGGPRAGSFAR